MTVLEEYAPYIHSKEMEEREAYYWGLYPNIGRDCIRDLLLCEFRDKRNKVMVERFLIPQATDYNTALQEVKNGKKVTHWIWYIFPQMRGLGHSQKSEY